MSSSGSLNILLIGSGGREHAIAWKISQSKRLGKLFVCPGNGGTSKIEKVTNVSNLNPNNPQQFQEIAKFCKQQQVDFVVVGPEQPLVEGIVETLSKEGISVFGPSKKAAIIEGSKAFSKDFMKRNNIPTAKYEVFTEFATALQYVSSIDFPIVVKASGLAAGKGVILPEGMLETLDALKSLMVDKTLQNAGDEVIIEERLYGPEVSVLAFTDGYSISIMPPAQDHKRVFDDDSGPNTGGMGAYAPTPIVSKEFIDEVREKVFKPTIDGMRKEGRPYVGVLYAGLLLSDKGMQVLEFNCRFGDPETQAILPLLETDLIDIIEACIERRLDSIDVKWKTDCSAVSVVAASGGYPGFRSDLGVYRIGKYEVGNAIQGIEDIKEENVHVFHAGTAVKDGNLVTSGGRVLAVTAVSNDLTKSIEVAYSAISKIKFDKIHYRKDIAARALKEKNSNSVTYRDSGVDIDAGDNFVDAIKPFCKSTARPGSNADLGGFGGLFDLKATGIEDPVLVSGTDGVGTKLLIAQSIGKHDTIGIDLVAMNVNDVVVQGADPLFFLDYYACGKLEVKEAVEVVKGIAEGCRQAGCSLIGGETAEMPGMYPKGKYDLAGFAVGVVERAKILPNFNSQVTGDILLGLASSGIHSNGYSLVRRLVQKSGVKYEDAAPFQKDKKLGEVLLTPTKIYVKSCLKAIKVGGVKGMAHITGGGLPDNLPRALHDNLAAEISLKSWELPPVFKWLKEIGNVEQNELLRTFNCGIGMVVVVSAENAKEVERVLKENGEQVFTLGKLIPRVEKDHAVVFVE